jgi:hypothetical protein
MSRVSKATKDQSASQFSLISGGKKYQVKQSFLVEKLSVFRDNPSLLNSGAYLVQTAAEPEAFGVFLLFLEGGSPQIVAGMVNSLRELCVEFGFSELHHKCEGFETQDVRAGHCVFSCEKSIYSRLLQSEERQNILERRLSNAEGELLYFRERNISLESEVNRLSGKLSAAESELSSQKQQFEAEQHYRRGCEYFFGTNGFGEHGQELSQILGFSELKKSADLGHTDGQYRTGKCLAWGQGCKADLREGLRYYRLSADSGNSFAENQFGACLRIGEGVEKNEGLAFENFKRSASSGNACGQNSLGFCFELGIGTAKDLRSAFENYKQSMEQGNSYGQCNYGRCLVEGLGTSADATAGVAILKLAVDQGLPLAQYTYAIYLENGRGVARNRAEAAEYYRRAMEGGYSDAKAGYERCRQ